MKHRECSKNYLPCFHVRISGIIANSARSANVQNDLTLQPEILYHALTEGGCFIRAVYDFKELEEQR